MDEEKYISSDALLKRLKNQAEVLTKTPEEFALLDKVMTIIRSEPAVNQKPEPEDDWETVEVVQTAAGSHVTRRAFRHSACGELLSEPRRCASQSGLLQSGFRLQGAERRRGRRRRKGPRQCNWQIPDNGDFPPEMETPDGKLSRQGIPVILSSLTLPMAKALGDSWFDDRNLTSQK